jgi:hypothetical protein
MTTLIETDETGDREINKLKLWEQKLFAHGTSRKELEEICMLLAHAPTKEAQELLKKFAGSELANQIEWLSIAMQEGQFHYLCPANDQEKKDFLAAKLVHDIEDELMELEMKTNEINDEAAKCRITYEAVKILVESDELDTIEEYVWHDALIRVESNLKEMKENIITKRKIMEQVKSLIKTQKYKDAEYCYLQNIH